MSNLDFIHKLKILAFLLEVKGESRFKVNAFLNAAETLQSKNIDIIQAVTSGEISNIAGFGSTLQTIANQYVSTGEISVLQEIAAEYPLSLYELKRIKGLGAKRIALLWKQLNIKNLDDLEEAGYNNQLTKIKGITPAVQESIFNSLTHVKAGINKILQDQSIQLTHNLLDLLRINKGIDKAELAGEARRFAEVIDTIEILIQAESDKIKLSAEVQNIIQEIKSTGVKIAFHYADKSNFYYKLNQLTGSPAYNKAFENEFAAEELINKNFDSEENLFKYLSIQYIPAEIREDKEAIEAAKQWKIPELVQESDLKGMLHFHSDWSDGRDTLKEMILQCKKLGFEYAAICDHSKAAAYANGLNEARVLQQFDEIDRLNKENLGIKILKGIESDILHNGDLDYPADFLAQFDIIVASIHSNFRMSKEEMTNRLIKAAENPYTTIIGHPTGRLLLTRAGYEIDVDKLIDACAANNKVIEINANPYRLDFSYSNAKKAKDKGVKISVNPDSHKTSTLSDIYIGLKSARKAWLTKNDIINCLNYEEFIQKYCKK